MSLTAPGGPRVVYDASILGHRQVYPESATGIPRVVENVAMALLASQACELRLCARTLTSLRHALEFLEGHASLRRAPMLRAEASTALAALVEAPIVKLTRTRRRSIPVKFAQRALYQVLRVVNTLPRPLTRGDLTGMDVFHSPFDPLPPVTRGIPGLHRFLMVHDLIPILYPEYFSFGRGPSPFDRILASLTPRDWALTNSECTRADLLNYRPDLDPARVFVTPLAADPALFHPVADAAQLSAVRAKYGVPEGLYLLSLNTLEPRKNLDHLVRAFAALVAQEQVPDLHLVLVGAKGWKTEALFAALAESGIARDRVILTGFVADADLAALYSGALGFVYPSLYEGFGLPPLEAMQCGVPVITSNTSSLPEVVGDAGILVAPTDEEALAQAMLALYQDDTLRTRLQAQSQARAQQFSWARCAGQTIAAYRTALAS